MGAIEPVKWNPPPRQAFEGPYAVNHRLAPVALLATPEPGPEDVVFDSNGDLLTGTEDGSILRFPSGQGDPDVLLSTGGRPLGLEIDPEGRLIICDAYRGLLRWDGRSLEVLADGYRGERFLFTNNASIATDGSIYFSVSSARFDVASYKLDLLEHSGTGRVFVLRPDGELELLVGGLQFANGVAVSGDDSFLIYAETGMFRLWKLMLSGPNQGRADVLVDNLPGFPDNLSFNSGVIWTALVSPRDPVVDLLGRVPLLAKMAARLPDSLQPAPKRYAAVFGFSENGRIVHNLQDPEGRYAVITSAREHEGRLYLGSLHDSAVGVIDLRG